MRFFNKEVYMKRKLLGILFATALIFSGCGENPGKEKPPVKQEETNQTQEDNEIKEGEGKEDEIKEDEQKEESAKVKIYYVNPSGEEIISKEVEVTGDSSEVIVSALKDEGLLTKECQVKTVNVDETAKTMVIDVNRAFGDRIRSTGTLGEEQIIQCTAKTYMEAYQCEKIKITEEGNPLETGHTVYENYISY